MAESTADGGSAATVSSVSVLIDRSGSIVVVEWFGDERRVRVVKMRVTGHIGVSTQNVVSLELVDEKQERVAGMTNIAGVNFDLIGFTSVGERVVDLRCAKQAAKVVGDFLDVFLNASLKRFNLSLKFGGVGIVDHGGCRSHSCAMTQK